MRAHAFSFFVAFSLITFSGCGYAPKSDDGSTKTSLPPIQGIEAKNKLSEKVNNAVKKENTRIENALGNIDTSYVTRYSGAILHTNFGALTVELYGEDTPLAVSNFIQLSEKKFYDQTKFHRVIKDFMIQGGDPNSKDASWDDDGTGGPGYTFPDEKSSKKLIRGSLAMANAGPDTNGSQFFIVTKEAVPWLDGKHTNFGHITKGMDVVKKIENAKTNERDHPTEDIVIESVELIKK